jgi:hypothetical protein
MGRHDSEAASGDPNEDAALTDVTPFGYNPDLTSDVNDDPTLCRPAGR